MAEPAKTEDPEKKVNEQAASTGNEAWVIKAQEQYGYLAAFITHAELGPLLRKAAQNGWTKETLQGELYKTRWWKTTSETVRNWQLLQSSDPAEANNRIEQKYQSLSLIAKQQGFPMSDSALRQVATASVVYGMDDSLTQQALFSHVRWKPKMKVGGVGGQQIANVKARALAYGVNMSDEMAFNYSRRIASGQMTVDGVEVDLRNRAKSKYGYLANDIDRGFTTQEILDPYVQQYAELLEVAPTSVSFTDPGFRQFFEGRGEKGTQLMSLSESAEQIRKTKEWRSTRQANQQAATFAETLLTTFGEVKV